jgi:hypothetical protein
MAAHYYLKFNLSHLYFKRIFKILFYKELAYELIGSSKGKVEISTTPTEAHG